MASMNEKKKRKHQQQVKASETKKIQRLMGWTLAIIVVVCLAFIAFNAASGPDTGKAVDTKEFHYDKQPALGAQSAPVKIVEFADFKCPACRQFEQVIIPQLKQDFVDNGTVQLYFINYPIISPDADSRTAAMAGEAVFHQNPAEFWKFYEAVYAHQGDEHVNWATADFLVQVARQSNVAVDYEKLKKDIDSNTFAQDVRQDEAIVGKLGVGGTPTIYINGIEVPVNDTFNYEALKEAIVKAKGETAK
jgi:protein-disulfide isomerase